MTETLTVPIGPNASIDGGPFAGFEADGLDGETDPSAGVLAGSDYEGHPHEYSIEDIEDALSDEMRASEPVALDTGDVYRPGHDGELVGTIDVPLVAGFVVEIYDLPGQGQDLTARLDNLRGDSPRREHFERKLQRHGGFIRGRH
jgi:hypothetical protein